VVYAPGYQPKTLDISFVDPKTLKPGNWTLDAAQPTVWGLQYESARPSLACSADGEAIIARSTFDSLLLTRRGLNYQWTRFGTGDMPLPNADGRAFICSPGQSFSAEGKPAAPDRSRHGAAVWCVPALQGPLSVSLNEARDANNRLYVKAMLHLDGEAEPLGAVPQQIGVLTGLVNWFTGQTQPFEKHVFVAPEYGVTAVIAADKSRIQLYRFDLDQVLKESKRDYLFVLSQPPTPATKGTPYRYAVKVKSKKGDVKIKLESSPPGMKLEDESTLTWDVPADFADKEASIAISISDASGQSVRHSFQLSIVEKQD
jgi:hypothetical protein